MDSKQPKYQYDLILLTDEDNLGFNPEEDQIILALTKQSKSQLRIDRISWQDPNFDWSRTKYVMFRSPWNYHYFFDQFMQWMEETSHKTTFINNPDIIKWNINKKYLLELNSKGIAIPNSVLVTLKDKEAYYESLQQQSQANQDE